MPELTYRLIATDPTAWAARVERRLVALESAAAPAGCDFPLEQQSDDWRARAERLLAERDEARRERDAYKKLTHDALDAVGVETHPPDLHGHRMVDRIYMLGRARDEAYEKLTQEIRKHYPPAFRIVVSQRDHLQQQLDASRAALAKIASYPPFDSSPSCMRKLATDALATDKVRPETSSPASSTLGEEAYRAYR